ncbi:MAG: tRNA (adenosine(37)-N6)-dimethylallyltransferase MiaA [Gorillibacterium sp.]|nr:tRNA (adenosine(37)-N6)-dimethylallyltransferase MiaA [Gorillibacterium sp.]
MLTNQQSSGKIPLLVLIGPTAVGKTGHSISIAQKWNAEIISGDSMQVYREMDIGTAKITKGEAAGIPHHLIDIVNPDEPFSAADFQLLARERIEDIYARGKLPFIVGGTGLYIESLLYNFEFSEGGADEAFREEQRAFLAEHGALALHKRLQEVDPVSAERLHPNDDRRIIRALEILHLTGIRLSEQLAGQKRESPYELCLVGLSMDRALLYKRIEERVDSMIKQGFPEEVEALLARGYRPDLPSMQGLGYKEIGSYVLGRTDLTTAVELLKKNTRHYAKRQLSWFRHMKEIEWVDVTNTENISKQTLSIDAIITAKITGFWE